MSWAGRLPSLLTRTTFIRARGISSAWLSSLILSPAALCTQRMRSVRCCAVAKGPSSNLTRLHCDAFMRMLARRCMHMRCDAVQLASGESCMRLMRPAVSSTAAWLPCGESLHSNCMTLPLLQPTSACTLFIFARLLLSSNNLRQLAICCPKQSCPSVNLTLEARPNSLVHMHDPEDKDKVHAGQDRKMAGCVMGRFRKRTPDYGPATNSMLPGTPVQAHGCQGCHMRA